MFTRRLRGMAGALALVLVLSMVAFSITPFAAASEEVSTSQEQESDRALTLIDIFKYVRSVMEERARERAEQNRQTYTEGEYLWPLPAPFYADRVTLGREWITHHLTGTPSLHNGIDIVAPSGTDIYAAEAGTVIVSEYDEAWGECVVIDHGDGVETLYAHLSERLVEVGDEVARGDVIGLVGATGYSGGSHLHFTISKDGSSVDPLTYFD